MCEHLRAAGKGQARPPEGEVWLWFWHSSHGFCSGLAARVWPRRLGSSRPPTLQLRSLTWRRWAGRWRQAGARVSAVSRLQVQTPGDPGSGNPTMGNDPPWDNALSCRVPAVSHTEWECPRERSVVTGRCTQVLCPLGRWLHPGLGLEFSCCELG